ncbi:hypothetical protein RN001_000444 [Aquatica leii]|uniref:Uncharacterized protein n=1 Tax=Aquatica leii TaxID=1421715 RepID=A0AAN7SQJ6_9COLE|nr:hypothetical protein RN001_000444 [Aquatica leii]
MEFFGITMYGFPDPIKSLLRNDYKEPSKPISLEERMAKGSKQTLAEMLSELDVYIGSADGYTYNSHDRLSRMRIKYVRKPVGPTDMYRYAGTDAQNCGFWTDDPAIKNSKWHLKTVFKHKHRSSI